MMSMSGRVLSEKLDVLRLTFYTSPISCLCLLPFYYLREVDPNPKHNLKHYQQTLSLIRISIAEVS